MNAELYFSPIQKMEDKKNKIKRNWLADELAVRALLVLIECADEASQRSNPLILFLSLLDQPSRIYPSTFSSCSLAGAILEPDQSCLVFLISFDHSRLKEESEFSIH